MSSRIARALPWGVFALAVLLAAVGNVLLFLGDQGVIEN